MMKVSGKIPHHSPSKVHNSAKRKGLPSARKPRGLPRPKSQASYNIPHNLRSSSTSHVPSSLLAKKENNQSRSSTPSSQQETPLIHLSEIKVLLDLIYRRNKNQHRNQSFWKWLSLLRRSITQLITLYQRMEATESKTTPVLQKADVVRKKFELLAALRSQRDIHEDWIRETLVPGCYVAFSSVVANTQFANLGVVLVGILADAVGVVGGIRRIEKMPLLGSGKRSGGVYVGKEGGSGGGIYSDDRSKTVIGSVMGVSTLITGPDQGEVVERVYDSSSGGQGVMVDALSVRGEDEGVAIKRRRIDDHDDGSIHMSNSKDIAIAKILQPRRILGKDLGQNGDQNIDMDEPLDFQTFINHSDPSTSRPTQEAHPTIKKISSSSLPSPSTRVATKISKPTTDTLNNTHSETRIQNKTKDKSTMSPTVSTTTTTKTMEKSKKKRKKGGTGNAIDDLFGGLL